MGDEGSWTNVTYKKKERRSSLRKESTESIVVSSNPVWTSNKNLTSPVKRTGCQVRRWRAVPPPCLPTGSIRRQQNVLLLDKWFNRIRDLPRKTSTEIIEFLVDHWQTFKALMGNKRFHDETASVVATLAVLAKYKDFREVEFIILMILTRVNIRQLPQNCRDVNFFLILLRIFSSFLERGSLDAKMWIRGRRWILITFEVAFSQLSNVDPQAECVLGQLQNLDLAFSKDESKVLSAKKTGRNQEPMQWNASSYAQNNFELTSKKSNGQVNPGHNRPTTNFVRTSASDGVTNDWETVRRKKKVANDISHMRSYPSRAELCDPPLMITPKGKRKQPDVNLSFPNNAQVSKAEIRAILTRLQGSWLPSDLPSYIDDVVRCVSQQRHRAANPNSEIFISEVCRSPLVQRIQEFLQLKMEYGLPPKVFHNITIFCSAVLKAHPDIFSEHFGNIVDLTVQIADASEQYLVIPHIRKQLLDLRGTLVQTRYISDQLPHESFRDMFVVPTAEDFQSREIFLRPNATHGPYSSEEDYLDVQFRLLREDFLKPLRDGVAQIRGRVKVFDRSEETRFNAMRIYKNVTFGKNADRRAPGCLTMTFDPNRKLNIDWRISKRFMIGALLIISNDNFATLHLARVARRDLEYLSAGIVIIEPLWPELSSRKLCLSSFVVGESLVFFEPYLHVLNALQNTRANMFPLARYIVHADPSGELPDYLKDESNRRFKIPLAGAGGDGTVHLDIVSDEWPSPAEMGLNESQHEALVLALTQKVVLVQGPPGTGKTFLGLRIVSTLLMNPCAWRGSGDDVSPILIVCYTNHALDQFLVGLLGTTKNIVRLGGRCKDERLEGYMLKKNEDELSRDLKRLKWELHTERDEAEHELDCIQDASKGLNDNIGIVSWESFQLYQVPSAAHTNVPPDFSVVSWLEEGIAHSALSEECKRFHKQNTKWGNKCFTFEETFSNIESTIEELQQSVDEGRLVYEDILQYYKAKLQYLKGVIRAQVQPPVLEAHPSNLMDLDGEQRAQLYRYDLLLLLGPFCSNIVQIRFPTGCLFPMCQ